MFPFNILVWSDDSYITVIAQFSRYFWNALRNLLLEIIYSDLSVYSLFISLSVYIVYLSHIHVLF